MAALANEKHRALLPAMVASQSPPKARSSTAGRVVVLLGTVSLVMLVSKAMGSHENGCGMGSLLEYLEDTIGGFSKPSDDLCPQAAPLTPSKYKDVWEDLGSMYGTDDFKMKAVDWLAGAVRIPYVPASH